MNIRKLIRKNNKIFKLVHNLYAPIRYIKTASIRKKIANESKEKLKGINITDNNIFYFGIPMHTNLGDLAQTYCTWQWCEENYPTWKVYSFQSFACYDNEFVLLLKKIVKPSDIILFQSGYCTKETHRDHPMHLKIVGNFPNNRIVVLPQTVNFKDQNEYKKTANLYNAHKRMLFLARDRISYNSATQMFSNVRVELYPDIVTSLIGKYQWDDKRNGVLLCLRNDLEQLYSPNQTQRIREAFIEKQCDITDTSVDISNHELLKNLEKYLFQKFHQFASYEVVITDRYHGTIFSLLTNTPVIVLATVDHKVVTGLDWFKDVYDKQAVQMANSIDEAIEMAKKIIEQSHISNNSTYFKDEYYSKLKNMVEKI